MITLQQHYAWALCIGRYNFLSQWFQAEYFDHIFFLQSWAALSTPLVITLQQHYAWALCIARYNFLCQLFPTIFFIHVLLTRRLPIHASILEQSFCQSRQISHPVFLVFYIFCQHCLQYSALLQLCLYCKLSHQSGYFPSYLVFWFNEFLNRSAMSINIANSLKFFDKHFCNQPMFAFMQQHSFWAACTLPLSSCSTHSALSAALTTSYTHAAALVTSAASPGRCGVKGAEWPTRWHHSEGQHWDLLQLQ